MASPETCTNRLSRESSPYLRQHAHNPVDWYPWGPEALDRARELDRPIFLSIGYSACHWCHVMEHESFEDPETARILNENFVSIKVDREERPDLDQIYMTAVQMLTGQGGWPMSMFLTPDLKPFYGGTYFPPDDRYGRPSFKRLLLAIAEAWSDRRDEVLRSAGQIAVNLQGLGKIEPSSGADLNSNLIRVAASQLERACDRIHGGFGQAPKFPHAMDLRLLLRAWKRFGDQDALQVARLTLDHMAEGGMYDHIGGGFHRYSTDERWLVPHFEKMLYDNALLAVAYLEAYQATHEPMYREVVQETLTYVLREMTSAEGPFYSSQDADSEGVEGKFFVWSAAEIEAVLGPELADAFMDVYDVSPEGNWEGHSILNRGRTLAQTARLRNVSESVLNGQMTEAKRKLYAVRERRVHPGRDEKILTAWNGLMIDALAQAALPLEEPSYAQAASKAADFILNKMRGPDGRLLRTAGAGALAKLNAYLEDYAYFINALVSLYEATFEPRQLEAAIDLAGVLLDQFWDPADGGFFFTGNDHEALIARSKDPHDSSLPAANSVAALALLRLATLTGRDDFRKRAEETLRLFSGLMSSAPQVAGQMLIALDFHIGPVDEFAIVGDPNASGTRRVLKAITEAFRPNKVLALKCDALGARELDKLVPLLKDKPAEEAVTTYICQNFACQEPLHGPEAVEKAVRQ